MSVPVVAVDTSVHVGTWISMTAQVAVRIAHRAPVRWFTAWDHVGSWPTSITRSWSPPRLVAVAIASGYDAPYRPSSRMSRDGQPPAIDNHVDPRGESQLQAAVGHLIRPTAGGVDDGSRRDRQLSTGALLANSALPACRIGFGRDKSRVVVRHGSSLDG